MEIKIIKVCCRPLRGGVNRNVLPFNKVTVFDVAPFAGV